MKVAQALPTTGAVQLVFNDYFYYRTEDLQVGFVRHDVMSVAVAPIRRDGDGVARRPETYQRYSERYTEGAYIVVSDNYVTLCTINN